LRLGLGYKPQLGVDIGGNVDDPVILPSPKADRSDGETITSIVEPFMRDTEYTSQRMCVKKKGGRKEGLELVKR